jgi:dephospho-CoA kinase
MLKIGLTGGIGSGKSTVAKIFEVLGVPVYYADDAARRLLNENENLKQEVVRHFGAEAYISGELNRNHISEIVFNNKEKLELLNSLTHPAVMRDSEEWTKVQTAPYTIREAALIFESGVDRYLDYVIGVSAPENLRIERTTQRDSIARDQVLARMKNQMDEEEKMKRCDFVIYNDELQLVMHQVLQLDEKFSAMAGA